MCKLRKQKIKTVINTLDDVAKSDKVFNGLSKAVKFASNNVNPLIVASSGLNVALADKKIEKCFNSRNWKYCRNVHRWRLDEKHLDGILNKLPISKKWLPIIKGIVFVTGSITSSSIGQKIAQNWNKPIVEQSKNLKNPDVYQNLSIKA